jgi:multicomponent Na+:H+ antiporter subunit C
MIVANYLTAAGLFSLGAFSIVSSRHLIKIVLGLSLMESSTYLLMASMAYRKDSTAPVLSQPPKGVSTTDLGNGRRIADPVLQNFCLTAIVIGVAVTAVFLAVVVRLTQHYRTTDAARIRQLHG